MPTWILNTIFNAVNPSIIQTCCSGQRKKVLANQNYQIHIVLVCVIVHVVVLKTNNLVWFMSLTVSTMDTQVVLTTPRIKTEHHVLYLVSIFDHVIVMYCKTVLVYVSQDLYLTKYF